MLWEVCGHPCQPQSLLTFFLLFFFFLLHLLHPYIDRSGDNISGEVFVSGPASCGGDPSDGSFSLCYWFLILLISLSLSFPHGYLFGVCGSFLVVTLSRDQINLLFPQIIYISSSIDLDMIDPYYISLSIHRWGRINPFPNRSPSSSILHIYYPFFW